MAGRQTAAGELQVNRQAYCGSGGRQEWQVGRQQQESDRSTGRWAVAADCWFGANGRPAAYLMFSFDKRPKVWGQIALGTRRPWGQSLQVRPELQGLRIGDKKFVRSPELK
jgi:hypothetical protein